MLGTARAFASFSVDDIEQAKTFYKEVLRVDVEEQSMDGGYTLLNLNLSGVACMLYPKPDHQPATYTVLNFWVDDIEQIVSELTGRGVQFEQYDEPMKTDERGIAQPMPGLKQAWFKDPAGNIIALLQETA